MGVQVIGGCCGLGVEYIRLLWDRLPQRVPLALKRGPMIPHLDHVSSPQQRLYPSFSKRREVELRQWPRPVGGGSVSSPVLFLPP